MLSILDNIPPGLTTATSRELHKILPTPTLIQIKGQGRPLLVSCLMHGNEFTGLLAIQELLKKYGVNHWPRPVYLFFSNIAAAKEGRRHLDGQVDYNRIWQPGELPENKMAAAVTAHVTRTPLFACVDIHNNTGRNPHYSVITNLGLEYLNMAALFGNLSMCFLQRIGTFTEGFADHCPAITLEAGQPGVPQGTKAVLEFIEKLLALEDMPTRPVAELDLTVLDTVGTIKINPSSSVAVGHGNGDISFEKDFDLMNFTEVVPGKVFGCYKNDHRLQFKTQQGKDIGADYFDYRDGQIIVKKGIIPAMITQDERILKSDCVCYAMKKMLLSL